MFYKDRNKLAATVACVDFKQGGALLLLSLIAAFLAIYPLANFDIFWHLANGRVMLEEGRIVNEEVFSYTARGVAFNNHEWLAQVIFQLIYDLGGGNALIFFKAAIVVVG